MEELNDDWERKKAEIWKQLPDCSASEFLERIEKLVADLPKGNPLIPFEMGCAFDSTGQPEKAIPHYKQALSRGIKGLRRRRTSIQLVSSLRNVGKLDESLSEPPREQIKGSATGRNPGVICLEISI